MIGVVAIAPYLGERTLSTDIANAGGLAKWNGPLDSGAACHKSARFMTASTGTG